MHSLKTKKHSFVKKNVFVILILVILCGVTIYYATRKDELYNERFIIHFNEPENNASCHYLVEGDALPSAEGDDFSPRPNSIFFHETSCRGGLTSRQACAIESAARAHPRKQIYVLFSAPVTNMVLRRSCLRKLRMFPNIKMARVHLTDYAKKTPLEEMVAAKAFHQSEWWIEHTSDVLRYLTLYKWGGIYLDTDMLVVKPLLPLGYNWVAKEDNNLVNAAAIAISMDHLGRRLANALMNEVKTTYRPDVWIHNGPGAITRVLKKICNTDNLEEWSSKTCDGLDVYQPELIYPLHYSRKDEYFKAGDLEQAVQDTAFTHHLWNKLTYEMKIEKDSPYAKMAAKHCPTIFQMYGDEFGS